jgi:chromosome partitioning protein
MSARITTVLNFKGGSGKSTISMHLAGTLAKRGAKVLVCDADPQGTSLRWAASADEGKPFPAAVAGLGAAGSKVNMEIRKFVADYDHIIVDCPPAVDSPIPLSALSVSDLGLVPIIPSPLDMWATLGIRKVVEVAQGINTDLAARLVVNQCQPNTTLAREVLDVLPEFGIELCSTWIHHRTAYRQAAVIGGTVHDIGSAAAQAITEIDALTEEVLGLLGLGEHSAGA